MPSAYNLPNSFYGRVASAQELYFRRAVLDMLFDAPQGMSFNALSAGLSIASDARAEFLTAVYVLLSRDDLTCGTVDYSDVQWLNEQTDNVNNTTGLWAPYLSAADANSSKFVYDDDKVIFASATTSTAATAGFNSLFIFCGNTIYRLSPDCWLREAHRRQTRAD
jgi:hypothetical protein